jgi:hypothetical protein
VPLSLAFLTGLLNLSWSSSRNIRVQRLPGLSRNPGHCSEPPVPLPYRGRGSGTGAAAQDRGEQALPSRVWGHQPIPATTTPPTHPNTSQSFPPWQLLPLHHCSFSQQVSQVERILNIFTKLSQGETLSSLSRLTGEVLDRC